MRKLLILFLIAVMLCGAVSAYEAPQDFTGLTLDEIVKDFMEYYQLSEQNFCISYYNTVTGESYDFNENKFAMAASTYKLPLNMFFYEMEQAGQIASDEPFLWTGMTLAEVHRQSVMFSNNEVSEAMAGYWNNYYQYKENMRKYTSMPLADIDPSYYQTNNCCTRMMMDTLKYLYANSSKFEELIGYMKAAMPGEYFQAGVQEYEVAHKYGSINGFVNDVGIIYAPQPILLAVYTQGIYGDGICAQAARLMTDYVVWQVENNVRPMENISATVTEVSQETVEETVEEPMQESSEEIIEEPVEEFGEEAVEEEPIEEETIEEEPVEEEPVEEEPEQAVETEEDPEQTEEEARRAAREAERKKKRTRWTVIGLGSVVLLLAIPLVMRRRLWY